MKERKETTKINHINFNEETNLIETKNLFDLEAFINFLDVNEKGFREQNKISFIYGREITIKVENPDSSVNVVLHIIRLSIKYFNRFVDERNEAINRLSKLNSYIDIK